MFSNSQIDKIGDKLKQGGELSELELSRFLEWRNSFESVLNYFYKRVQDLAEQDDLVSSAKRLKRIESIKIKLKRFKTLRLSSLQDVAGVRLILKDTAALDRTFTRIRGASAKSKLKRLDDYCYRPKSDGYRGIHLVYQNPSNKLVEIQLRTELQHVWATSVEVYGFLKSTSFKTGSGEADWKEFFCILSSYFALLEDSPVLEQHQTFSIKKLKSKLRQQTRKLNAIEILNAAANGIEIVIQKKNKAKMGKHAIVELDYNSKTTTIEVYSKKDFDKAVSDYTSRELFLGSDSSRNVVFVNIESVEALEQAFPNYFLDTRKLLKILSELILEGVT